MLSTYALKMRPDQERVRHLLTDTVTLLCKNGLQYQTELRVQGVLGITLDNDDVFIVHINEKLGAVIGGATTLRNDGGDAAKTHIDADQSHVVGRGDTPTAVSPQTPEVVRKRRRASYESSASPALATNIQRSIKRQGILKENSLPGGDRIRSSLPSVTGSESAVSSEQEFHLIKVKKEVDNVVTVEQSQDVEPKIADASQNIPHRGEQLATTNRTLDEILRSRQTFGDILDAAANPPNAGADCFKPPPTKWRAISGNAQESFGGSSEMGPTSDGGVPFITGIIRNETVGDVALRTKRAAPWDPSQMTEDNGSLSSQDSKMILDNAAGRSAWDTPQPSGVSVVNVTPHSLPNVSEQSSGPMVHCKRATYRGTWSNDSIVAAMHAVREDNTSINKAAAMYKIPKTTFLRHLKKNAENLRVQACRFISGSQNSSTSD